MPNLALDHPRRVALWDGARQYGIQLTAAVADYQPELPHSFISGKRGPASGSGILHIEVTDCCWPDRRLLAVAGLSLGIVQTQ